MSDYTPVPEADLEAAIMETLTLLRQNSTEGRTASDELHTLIRHWEQERSVREAQYKTVESLLYAVNATMSEASDIIKNSKPTKKSGIENTIDILKIVIMASMVLFFVVGALFVGSELGIRFRYQ